MVGWPVHGANRLYRADPNWQDLMLFYEYFHGDTGSGVGASHQTAGRESAPNFCNKAANAYRSSRKYRNWRVCPYDPCDMRDAQARVPHH